jgi:diacylglycerol O-acyltransferase / trehalose O-mycolyltransferase
MSSTPVVSAARTLPLLAALLALVGALVAPPSAQAFSREGLPVEYLDVYSTAMGRNVRVELQSAGPGAHAVYLLDGLRAQDDYSGWDVNTAAFEWFFGSGVSVVMPVGGQSSFYADWYSPSTFNRQPYTYKWETFLTRELPDYLAAQRQVATSGNAVVGVSMSGSSALTLAAFHPDRYRYAASLSGYLNPSDPAMAQAIRVAMLDAGGFNVDNMWGPPWDPAWRRHDPVIQASRLVANGTRLWVYCTAGSADPAAPPPPGTLSEQAFDTTDSPADLDARAIASNRAFQAAYVQAGGTNATFGFPPGSNAGWAEWGAQLQALKPDLIATLNG